MGQLVASASTSAGSRAGDTHAAAGNITTVASTWPELLEALSRPQPSANLTVLLPARGTYVVNKPAVLTANHSNTHIQAADSSMRTRIACAPGVGSAFNITRHVSQAAHVKHSNQVSCNCHASLRNAPCLPGAGRGRECCTHKRSCSHCGKLNLLFRASCWAQGR